MLFNFIAVNKVRLISVKFLAGRSCQEGRGVAYCEEDSGEMQGKKGELGPAA
jgi:hypothetical protein